jgi:hypothetical protein
MQPHTLHGMGVRPHEMGPRVAWRLSATPSTAKPNTCHHPCAAASFAHWVHVCVCVGVGFSWRCLL